MHIENQKINQIKALCKQHKVKTLFAFGSVTRDDFKADSDIDLVVVAIAVWRKKNIS